MARATRATSFLARVISASMAGLIVKYPPAWHVSTEVKARSSAVGGSAGRFVLILLAKSVANFCPLRLAASRKVRRAEAYALCHMNAVPLRSTFAKSW